MTSFIMSVAFDCTDPRALARFWAAVTGYAPDLKATTWCA